LQVADEDQNRADQSHKESSNGSAQYGAYDMIQDVSIVVNGVKDTPPDVPFKDVPFLGDVVQDVPDFVPYKDVPLDADDFLQDITVDDPVEDVSVVQDVL